VSAEVATSRIPAAAVVAENAGAYVGAWFHLNPLGMIRQFFCLIDLLMPPHDPTPCVCFCVLSLHYYFFALF
jgi:hypothetical protein